MRDARFSTVSQSITSVSSRRAWLGALFAGSLGLLAWSGAQDTAAKNCKKIKDKKKRKKCLAKAPDPTTQPPLPQPPEVLRPVTTFATAGMQTYAVPGAGSVTAEALGAAGGVGASGVSNGSDAGGSGGLGGNGGKVTATFAVAAGETLQINVGSVGGNGGSSDNPGAGGGGAAAGGGTTGLPNVAVLGAPGGVGVNGGPANAGGNGGAGGGGGIGFGPNNATLVPQGGSSGVGQVTITFTPA